MYVRIPFLRDHGILKLVDLNDQRLQPVCASTWDIGVPEKKDVFWSIVLALLMPNKNSSNNFNALVECLSGKKQVATIKSIRNAIQRYNPLLNRHACFYDSNVISLVRMFERNIKRYIKSNNIPETYQEFRMHQDSSKFDEMKLRAASLMLKCRISVICEPYEESLSTELIKPKIFFFPKEVSKEISSWGRDIVLYCKTKIEHQSTRINHRVFTFGLSSKAGYVLQKVSLEKILRSTSLDTQKLDFKKLYELPGIRENFIITILKSNNAEYKELIFRLYQQPPDILWQLSEAGFVTNPTEKDLLKKYEPNAFFYAVCSGQIKTLYLLYKYATSIPRLPGGLSRTPDPEMLNSFKEISSSLADARDAFQKLPETQEVFSSLINIEELLQVHDFQLEIRQKMFDVNTRVDFSEELFEIKRTKDMLITIINVYASHFHSTNPVEIRDSPSVDGYRHYVKFLSYFSNLDLLSALFFFDYVFLLKNKLRLDEEQFENIESAFVCMVFLNKYFANNVMTSVRAGALELSTTLRISLNLKDLILTHNYLSRIKFEKELVKFEEHLSNVCITNENTSDGMSETAGYNLRSEPLIKDELILFRLNYYLDLATKLDFENNNVTAIFAIQRALQILGECIKPDICDIAPTVGKSFLISSFVDFVSKDLGRIRDFLLHHEIKQTQPRLSIEQDKTFFKNMQNELKVFKDALNHIFKLQRLRTDNYVFQNRIKMIKAWQESPERADEKTDYQTAANNCEQLLDLSGKSVEERKQLLEMYRNILQEQLSMTAKKLKKLLNSSDEYENHFQTHFSWIENHKSEHDIEVKTFEYRFICIQLLLKFILGEVSGDDGIQNSVFYPASEKIEVKIQDLYNLEDKELISAKIEEILNDHRALKDEVYQVTNLKTSDEDAETPLFNNAEQWNRSMIHRFHLVLKNFYFISDTEKESICSEVPERFKINHEALISIRVSLQQLDYEMEGVVAKMNEVDLKQKKKLALEKIVREENLPELKKFIDTNDYYGTLLKSLDENSIDKKLGETLCEKFKLTGNSVRILEKITKGKKKPADDKALDFFCDRVTNLKKLVIDDNSYINKLWKNSKSLRSRRIIHDQIVYLYTQQPKLQAAVEFLLCDSMVILKKKCAKLPCLWFKTNCLFNGIILRNALAHGNPLFEAVSKFFDPSDLPNEIVDKTLDLISDADAILAIRDLQAKTKLYFGDFVRLVSDSNDEENREVINSIKMCKKWQEYARLIPLVRVCKTGCN